MVTTEVSNHAGRERRAYISAVLDWQSVHGCERATAEATVSHILGIDRPSIADHEWRQPKQKKAGRPTGRVVTRKQNFGLLAVYFERNGVRTMQAQKLAKRALARGETLSKSKAMLAVSWARGVLLGINKADKIALHARAAWIALGQHGGDPIEMEKAAGSAPGRPRKYRFKGTNYRGI